MLTNPSCPKNPPPKKRKSRPKRHQKIGIESPKGHDHRQLQFNLIYISDSFIITISYVHAPNTVKRYSELRKTISMSHRAPQLYWVLPAAHLMIHEDVWRLPSHEYGNLKNREILLMEEILHHPTCMIPCKQWAIYHINWCRISSINSINLISFDHLAESYTKTTIFLYRNRVRIKPAVFFLGNLFPKKIRINRKYNMVQHGDFAPWVGFEATELCFSSASPTWGNMNQSFKSDGQTFFMRIGSAMLGVWVFIGWIGMSFK